MLNASSPRIEPVLPAEWDKPVLDALDVFPSGKAFVLSAWNGRGVLAGGVNSLGSMLHHPVLAQERAA